MRREPDRLRPETEFIAFRASETSYRFTVSSDGDFNSCGAEV